MMTFPEDGFELNDDTLIFWRTVHVRKVWVTMDWIRELCQDLRGSTVITTLPFLCPFSTYL